MYSSVDIALPKVYGHAFLASRSAVLIAGCIVVLSYVAFYVFPLGLRPLFIPDEVRYGEIAREMLASGDWIVPHLNGLLYFEKPPMGHWLNAIAIMLFGENNFSVRIMSALFAGVTAVGVFCFARARRYDLTIALASSFVYLTTLAVYVIGTYSVLDTMFSGFVNLGIMLGYLGYQSERGALQPKYLVASGLLIGCAFLTKGFLAFVLPGLVLGTWLLLQKRFVQISISIPLVLLTSLAVITPWAYAIHQAEPDFWRYFIWVEHIQRFMAENAQHKQPIYFYLMCLPLIAFPWLAFVPAAFSGLRHLDGFSADEKFLTLWMVLPFLFFTASSGKLPTYILPCLAPFALLLVMGVKRCLAAEHNTPIRVGLLLNGLMFLFCSGVLLFVQFSVKSTVLYQPVEIYKFWILVMAMVVSALSLGYLVWRKNHAWSLISNGAICIVLLTILNQTLPQRVYDSKAPGRVFAQLQEILPLDAVVLVDGSLVRAAAWYLKRHDLYLYRHEGELKYGAEQAHDVRYIDANLLPSFIESTSQQHVLALICKRECVKETLALIPDTANRLVDGNVYIYTIDGRLRLRP